MIKANFRHTGILAGAGSQIKARFGQGGVVKESMNNLANILTIARLALLPFMILLFFIPADWAAWSVLALYTVGAISDWLDGWVARRYSLTSEFGRFLDPIADKIFVVTILLMLIATDRINGVWVLAVIVILTREFLVAGLREFLGPKNIVLPVTWLAKWKTGVQMVATGFLIVAPALGPWTHWFGLLGLTGAAVLTVVTGLEYMKAGWVHIKG
jgi:CDP-diacylglycerol--glycerol-3-phosphate 3-phosphatidyltransferase